MRFAYMPDASISSSGLPECGMFLMASSRERHLLDVHRLPKGPNGDIGWPANCHWRGKQRVRMSGAEHVIDDLINGHRNLIDSHPNEA